MLPRLEFTQEQVDPTRWGSSSDHGFQNLVRDLLRSAGREVHGFEAAGNDGGIDIFERLLDMDGRLGLAVWECKYVSTSKNTLGAARGRWLKTQRNLEKNLSAATGPPSGQRRYRPWYDYHEPVRAYEIWFGARLKNLDHFKALELHIRDFFRGLADQHEHLAHLANLDVTVPISM
jgi:hypothetical protein